MLLDDLDHLGGPTLGHYLKRWADQYAVTGEVKGATLNVQHDVFIVTSNYTIREIFGPKAQEPQEVKDSKNELVKAI